MTNQNNFYIVDRFGELFTEDAQTEKEAVQSLRYWQEEQGIRGLKVVRFDRLRPDQQAALKAFEEKVAEVTAKMMGKRSEAA